MSHQKGFSLLIVLVVIIILGLGSMMLLQRSGEDMGAGASRRDSELSQGLAEAAANLVLSRFIAEDVTVADLDGNGIVDRISGYADLAAAPAILPLSYAFYPESGNDVQPIQRVATGQSVGASNPLSSQVVPSGTAQLSPNDLFVSGTIRPLLYAQSGNGLTASANTWSEETSKNKAAVWFEYELNPDHDKWADVYVASASQVGNARSYVRRYVGSYTDQLGGMISPITESSLHAGGDTGVDTCIIC